MEKVEILTALAEAEFGRDKFSSSLAHYEEAKQVVDRIPDLNLGFRAAAIHFQIALCLFNLSKPKDAVFPCMGAESLCKQLLKELTNEKYLSLTGAGLSLSRKEEDDLECLPVYLEKIQKKLNEIWDLAVPIPEINIISEASQAASTTPVTKPFGEESVPTEQSRFSWHDGTTYSPHGVKSVVPSTSTARTTKRPRASQITSITPVTEPISGESVPTEQSRFFWQKDTAYSPHSVSVAIPYTSIARETRHQDDKMKKRHKSTAGIDSPQDMKFTSQSTSTARETKVVDSESSLTKKAKSYLHMDTTNNHGGIKLLSPKNEPSVDSSFEEDEESDS